MKILEVTHAWDALTAGGAERSAAGLTDAIRATGLGEAVLAACVPTSEVGDSGLGYDEDREVVLVGSTTDWVFFQWHDPRTAQAWTDVLKQLRPDVVHLHHYAQVGIDLPRLIHSVLPEAIVALTLHEFMAMCPRSGQLVDSMNQLCSGPAPRKCAHCMSWPIDYVAARQHYVAAALRAVDLFISPSQFLADRYMDWGLPPERMYVLANAVVKRSDILAPRSATDPSTPLRITYLGQHTPFKGLGILMDALGLLRPAERRAILVNVFGGGADRFGHEFAASIADHPVTTWSNVRMRGPYANSRVGEILTETDVVVVPSSWWENSPVVIDEALAAGVPVICSDIGGMAEKIVPGRDGWHFSVGDAGSLATVLGTLISDRALLARTGMRRPKSAELMASLHVEVFRQALLEKSQRGDL